MRKLLGITSVSATCLMMLFGCGGSRLPGNGGPGEGGTMEISLGAGDTWPNGVQSARVRMFRPAGATGCGSALDVFSVCLCVNAGTGCDYAQAGTSPTAAVNNLCSGSWQLDT